MAVTDRSGIVEPLTPWPHVGACLLSLMDVGFVPSLTGNQSRPTLPSGLLFFCGLRSCSSGRLLSLSHQSTHPGRRTCPINTCARDMFVCRVCGNVDGNTHLCKCVPIMARGCECHWSYPLGGLCCRTARGMAPEE